MKHPLNKGVAVGEEGAVEEDAMVAEVEDEALSVVVVQ